MDEQVDVVSNPPCLNQLTFAIAKDATDVGVETDSEIRCD